MKKSNNKENIITVDATGIPMGRLATKVAIIIRGKTSPQYLPNMLPKTMAKITNFDKIVISEKKIKSNIFYKHSGYPGGLKKIKWSKLYEKDPKLLFLKIINNMVPSNRHKKHILKHIIFE